MAKKAKGNISTIVPEEKKPLRYEDLVKANPYIRPWMLPFLPENIFFRDFIVSSVGMVLGGTASISLLNISG